MCIGPRIGWSRKNVKSVRNCESCGSAAMPSRKCTSAKSYMPPRICSGTSGHRAAQIGRRDAVIEQIDLAVQIAHGLRQRTERDLRAVERAAAAERVRERRAGLDVERVRAHVDVAHDAVVEARDLRVHQKVQAARAAATRRARKRCIAKPRVVVDHRAHAQRPALDRRGSASAGRSACRRRARRCARSIAPTHRSRRPRSTARARSGSSGA